MKILWAALAVLAACHHEDVKAERDRKRSSDDTTARVDPTPAVAAPAVLAPDDTTVYKVPIGKSPSLGGKSALVTVVEFGDFQCPFCRRGDKTMGTLRAKYGDDLRVVWKNEPMTSHDHAKAAADLALDARDQHGDAGFWAMHDDLFGRSSLDDVALSSAASAANVKATKTHHKAIDEDHALAVSLGVTATPVFFINGRRIVGAQGEAKFTRVIDAELAGAKALVAGGTPREQIYDAIMATAQTTN